MTKTLILLMITATTCLVENVINLVAGTPFEPPLGRVLLTVARGLYVGPGFTGVLGTNGEWTFAPPAVDEVPVDPTTVAEELALAKAAVVEVLARIAAAEAKQG